MAIAQSPQAAGEFHQNFLSGITGFRMSWSAEIGSYNHTDARRGDIGNQLVQNRFGGRLIGLSQVGSKDFIRVERFHYRRMRRSPCCSNKENAA